MDNIKFGRFIRESRQAKGMTQKQLAEKIHVSDKAVSKWENGAGFPDIKILEPLAACLGVSLLELMQGEKMGKWDERFVVPPDVIVPFHAVRASYAEEGIPFFASSASFVLSDALCMNAFKQEMKDLGFRSAAPTVSNNSLNGVALHVNDAAFIRTAEHLRQVIDTVRAFFPFLLLLIVGVGYLVTLLLLQSRKNEMALLRSIGLNRRKCFRVFFVDQLTLVITGVVAGSVLSVLIQGNYGGNSALAGGLVGICYLAGNSLALWKLLGVSVMEALSVES